MTTTSGPGRPRKPTKLKILSNTLEPSREHGRVEPEPVDVPIERPASMSDEAGALWDRIMNDYSHTGVLTRIDTEALRAYCDFATRYEQAAIGLDKSSPLVRTTRGDLVKNPLHQIARDNAMVMLRLARELGFTPSARASLETPETGDELDAWQRSG